MRLEFTHTPEDVVEAMRPRASPETSRRRRRQAIRALFGLEDAWTRSQRLSFRGGVLLVLAAPLFLVPAMIYLGLYQLRLWFVPAAFVLILCSIVWWYVIVSLTAWGVRREFAYDPANLGPVTFELIESGWRFTSPLKEITVEWPALKEFDETTNLFLLIDSAPATHIVPKRAFADDAQREAFRAMVQSHATGFRA